MPVLRLSRNGRRSRVPAPVREVFFYAVPAFDGTSLRAWTNDPDLLIDGPTVLLCNGLGTSPWAMPALLDPACGIRVISWDHRGTGGSQRPARRDAVTIDDFVDDAVAVLIHAESGPVAVMGWSIGVNTAFELAVQHPELVTGVFAVAGVPGGSFATFFAPLRVPSTIALAAATAVSIALRQTGWLLSPLARRLPVGVGTVRVLGHTGFFLPVPDLANAAHAIREFLQTPVDWYFHLALHASRHPPIPLETLTVPAAFVAGRWDILAGSRAMADAAARMGDAATYIELPASHFLPMEQPERLLGHLRDFLGRTTAQETA
jgi:pimeloyl-ACP methyl ester carboxylesterase